MNSSIFPGKTFHMRLTPVKHGFTYPVYMFGLDLDELKTLDKKCFLFAYNRFSLFSVYDDDYLSGTGESLKEKILLRLRGKSYFKDICKIELYTTPRYFNYVFNPASFFYCFNREGKILSIVLEVNNTFGERHTYVFDAYSKIDDEKEKFIIKKDFYVSPFNDLDGNYELTTISPNGSVDILLDITEEDNVLFRSRLWGETSPLTDRQLFFTTLKYPLTAALNIPRIMWEASKLYYGKKMNIQQKPIPSNPETIVVHKPSSSTRGFMHLFDLWLQKATKGSLQVKHPNGELFSYGNTQKPNAYLEIYDYAFFKRIVLSGDIAFGECYSEGIVGSDDIYEVLCFFAENLNDIDNHSLPFSFASKILTGAKHYLNKNSLSGSKKNISSHYDLSNDLFKQFLDPTMTYSSAYFEHGDTLEEAQKRKMLKIIQKASIRKEDHMLEIGCGWGSFAIEAVKQTGCKVTGITLSKEQLEYARARVQEEGLSENIDFQLCDYRKVQGKFDSIVSIEMLEAVGHQYFDSFFQCLEDKLKPNGLAVLQVITLPDQRYETAKYGVDWIQKHIFPGSTIPSLTALSDSMRRSSKFFIEDVENIGVHYAKTLRLWREAFLNKEKELEILGFDSYFRNAWEYYLAYCEAGFAKRELSDLQLVLTRPNNKRLEESSL